MLEAESKHSGQHTDANPHVSASLSSITDQTITGSRVPCVPLARAKHSHYQSLTDVDGDLIINLLQEVEAQDPTPDKWITMTSSGSALVRPLGPSEFAFYPASKDGLGDMFLHLAFRAPKSHLRPTRILHAWAVLRNRHPLLSCTVVLVPGDTATARGTPSFSFTPPTSTKAALDDARDALYFRHESKDDLILNYMNGPRTLSDSHLSYLVISTPGTTSTTDEYEQGEGEYDLLMCAPHFTGDGTSLHQCTHDLLALLALRVSDGDLLRLLDLDTPWDTRLPPAFETRCAVPSGRWARAAAKVNFLQVADREIGGHKFTRHQRAPAHTVFVERVYSEAETRVMLKRCKEHGVTVNHAIEAVCAVAWSRVVEARNPNQNESRDAFKDPIMLYTAINLRPHLRPFHSASASASSSPAPSSHDQTTYWFLALTYFTLVLPAFPPASPAAFWLRAQSAKAQTHRVVHSRFLVARALEMAAVRAARARGSPLPTQALSQLLETSQTTSTKTQVRRDPAPSAALLGLSLIGNLDATYDRAAYPGFTLHGVTTASRQKAGGALLLVHTFGGRLWVQLFYDENGFGVGVGVGEDGQGGEMRRFWEEVGRGLEEFLLGVGV
ncbi:hypothetical protein LshimejAT787_0703900 [Lyophyllum shimeji]|uniref:Acyltransferase n=1 Tax=Lyophyllum shimeji TaxID=47721 RepID=A0A9P3UQ77_LYOSH|nr:hypothetical protein LshimejAT787_0703900 [Lyophyllum shimeji]